MTLHRAKEDTPHGDADKQRLPGRDEPAVAGFDEPAPGTAIAGEWWRVTDEDETVAGYGWLDPEWGDAQITLLASELALAGNDEFDADCRSDLVTAHQPRSETETGHDR